MEDKSETKNKKNNSKKRTSNRINYNKKSFNDNPKDNQKKNTEVEKNDKAKNSTTFNLIEVIIIMIITSIFGIMIGSCVTYFKDNVIDKNSISKELEEFVDVYDEISNDYYGKINKNDLLESGIKGMIDFLEDPYSTYLDEESSTNLKEQLEGEFTGIGVTVKVNEDNNLYVVEVLEDSPAYKSGIKIGDIIIKINDKYVKDIDINEIIDIIRKEENSNINITIQREGKEQNIQLIRSKVELTSVTHDIIDNKFGYIKISIFAKNTADQLKDAMKELGAKKVESIIIDIRDNSGGYLESAEKVASLFLDKGTIIYQLDTKGTIEKIISKDEKKYNANIVLLINKSTASASEIFAAALNENLNVALVGEKTFGKGSVQKTKELSSGAMIKYTTQEWYTPKGNKINLIGINPNYEVINSNEYYKNPTFANDLQLQKAIEILKK